MADVTNEIDVERVASVIADGPAPSLVLTATGLLHESGVTPEKALKAIDPVAMARVFAVNAIGPAIVAKHFVPLLPRHGRSVMAALSARVGSIEDNRLGGWYAYRASKAALNQLMRTLAIELGRIRPDAIALALHPGTVLTGLSEPFRGDANAPGTFTPERAAALLLKVIEDAEPRHSGQVLAWDGSRIPY